MSIIKTTTQHNKFYEIGDPSFDQSIKKTNWELTLSRTEVFAKALAILESEEYLTESEKAAISKVLKENLPNFIKESEKLYSFENYFTPIVEEELGIIQDDYPIARLDKYRENQRSSAEFAKLLAEGKSQKEIAKIQGKQIRNFFSSLKDDILDD
jgi:pyruvate-formate lyase